MLNKPALVLFLFLSSFFSFSQVRELQFYGTIHADGIGAISLQLIIELKPDGVFEGQSITDYDGDSKTISKISGNLDSKKKIFSFKEAYNIRSKSDPEEHDFCYLSAQNLKVEEANEQSVISGNFKGFFSDSTVCTEGRIELVGSWLFPKAKKPAPKEEAPQVDTPQVEKVTFKPVDLDKPLGHGDKVQFDWDRDTVRLDVWDSFEEDNDRINIYCNGELISNSFPIKLHRQSFYLPLIDGKCQVRIEAFNEGTNPPNTVQVLLIGKSKRQALVSKLKKGESVELYFVLEETED